MNGVMIIPTGLGCEIGGHAGDATPAAKLIASVCDQLMLHPNVVNASDINEMPHNSLYVEGSILNRFLRGEVFLQEVYSNTTLLVSNPPLEPGTVNSVSSAIVTLGACVKSVELDKPLTMKAFFMKSGRADGDVDGWEALVSQVSKYTFDALAIHTPIECDAEVEKYYFHNGGVNPWGAVEAKASRLIATALDKPVAHAPTSSNLTDADFDFIVDPRMAPEVISNHYLFCVLKGLLRAPRLDYEEGLTNSWVDFMITPVGCDGEPHQACRDNDIPMIAVRENKTIFGEEVPEGTTFIAENYLEAAGIIACMREGVLPITVRRPLDYK